MNRHFKDDPENRIVLRICRSSPGFIPIVMNGQLHPVRETNLAVYPVATNLSAEDAVLGLEVLGCRLVRDARGDVLVQEPVVFRSQSWQDRARQIQRLVDGQWEERRTTMSDYLYSRDAETP